MTLVLVVQRLIDAIVAAALAVAGVMMLAGYAVAPRLVSDVLLYAGSMLWASMLTVSCLAAFLGALLRVEKPGRRQAWAFGLDLSGWAFAALCLLIYTVANAIGGGTVPGIAALSALTASLAGKYLRRWAAMRLARDAEDSEGGAA